MMKQIGHYATLILVFASFTSCGPSSQETQRQEDKHRSDSMIWADSLAAYLEWVEREGASSGADSSKIPIIEEEIPKSGRLMCSYSHVMTKGTSDFVNVYVSIKNSESKILDTLKKIVAAQQSVGDTTSIKYLTNNNILLYKNLTIKLVDPDSAFIITNGHSNETQEVRDTRDNLWNWTVQPTTSNKEAILIVKITAETPDGIRENFDDQYLHLKIHIDDSRIFRRLRVWIQDHVNEVIVLMIIPFLGFIGNVWLTRKKRQ